ncbi:MAG: hypothetical protein ACOC7K_00895 [bacterium]
MNANELAKPVQFRLGILLVVIGILLALDTFFQLAIVDKLWPLLIAMVGGGLIAIFLKGNARVPTFLVVGVYLLCFSGLALFCNFTTWAAMASLWPLFITFLGVVFLALYVFREKRHGYLLAGLLLVSISVVFCVNLALDSDWWWTIFVLAGVSILVAEQFK